MSILYCNGDRCALKNLTGTLETIATAVIFVLTENFPPQLPTVENYKCAQPLHYKQSLYYILYVYCACFLEGNCSFIYSNVFPMLVSHVVTYD